MCGLEGLHLIAQHIALPLQPRHQPAQAVEFVTLICHLSAQFTQVTSAGGIDKLPQKERHRPACRQMEIICLLQLYGGHMYSTLKGHHPQADSEGKGA